MTKRREGKLKAQGKYVQGAVPRGCFKPFLPELLAFTLKFRDVGVKAGCIPSRCFEGVGDPGSEGTVKTDQELGVICFLMCPHPAAAKLCALLTLAHLGCSLHLIAFVLGDG